MTSHHIHHIALYTPLPLRDGKLEKQVGGWIAAETALETEKNFSHQNCSFSIVPRALTLEVKM